VRLLSRKDYLSQGRGEVSCEVAVVTEQYWNLKEVFKMLLLVNNLSKILKFVKKKKVRQIEEESSQDPGFLIYV